MMAPRRILMLGAATLIGVACAERVSSPTSLQLTDAAFTTTPLGFGSTSSSFGDGSGGEGDMLHPEGPRGGHHGPRGPNGLPGDADFMGGGFGPDFLGGPFDGGRPFDHDGALAASCAFNASSGIVTCSSTHEGLTVNQTISFKDASGAAQTHRDSTTNVVTTHTVVSGTRERRDDATSTVNHTSDRTVKGLAKGSTQRTVNGTSAGTETTTGTDTAGTFTAARVIGDTTSGVIIPIVSGRPTYPTAGTVIRSMKVTVTYSGQSPVSSSRREVVTYDGTATATLVITHDGTTKTCSLPLPHGRPTCQ